MLVKTLAPLLLAALLCADASAASFLADRHGSRNLACDVCHNGTALKTNDKGEEACVGCHGGYEAVYAKVDPKYTKLGQTNPHAQHDGDLPCSTCHKGHKPGENYCLGCHSFEFKVP